MWKRLATAIVFVPVFVVALLHAPAVLFHAFVVALAGAASWELSRMFERAGRRTYGSLGVAASIVITASFLIPGQGPAVALTLAVLVVLSAPLLARGEPSTEPAATTVLGLVYVSWLLGHALLLRNLSDGAPLVLFLVGVTWIGESAAYGVGNAIGRTKLAPTISPRKTVEGALGQVAASLLGALLLRAWLVPTWGVGRVILAGLLLGVVGQVGDLAESVIKRSLGTKDTGGLVPGHGGVLDRLDSLLFTIPAFFYYVTFLDTA